MKGTCSTNWHCPYSVTVKITDVFFFSYPLWSVTVIISCTQFHPDAFLRVLHPFEDCASLWVLKVFCSYSECAPNLKLRTPGIDSGKTLQPPSAGQFGWTIVNTGLLFFFSLSRSVCAQLKLTRLCFSTMDRAQRLNVLNIQHFGQWSYLPVAFQVSSTMDGARTRSYTLNVQHLGQ